MHTLVFATQNPHKLQEVKALLPDTIRLISLQDLGYLEELPETHDTLHENALEKARFIYTKFGYDCFAEDTGLEVEALHGAPGVYSARYAGNHKNHSDNICLLLKNLQGIENRTATFRTVIALIFDNHEYLFEGTVKGHITEKPIGDKGFGYDPVFVPEGCNTTFAQLDINEKNKISHRALAFQQLKFFLTKILPR